MGRPCARDADGSAQGGLGKLRWRCRRGMKELDLLLTRFLDDRYAEAPPEEQRSFRGLLELPDPVIYDYLLGRDSPADPNLKSLVLRIAARPSNDR
jgi:antitoxin CptB